MMQLKLFEWDLGGRMAPKAKPPIAAANEGKAFGTAAYMSPEHHRSQRDRARLGSARAQEREQGRPVAKHARARWRAARKTCWICAAPVLGSG